MANRSFVLAIVFLFISRALVLAGEYHAQADAVCSDCHTTHYSERGTLPRQAEPGGPFPELLMVGSIDRLCLSCHDGTDPYAPDVMAPVVMYNGSGSECSGGGFFSSPDGLFSEQEVGSVGIIEHGYRTKDQWRQKYGTYNVGWVSIRNDPPGRACLEWWQARCLEWCYDRVEDSKYADQRYLDDWPSRFEQVVAGWPETEVAQFAANGRSPWQLWKIRRGLRRLRPDVLHYNDSHAISSGGLAAIGQSIPARIAARRLDFDVRSPWRYRMLCDRARSRTT